MFLAILAAACQSAAPSPTPAAPSASGSPQPSAVAGDPNADCDPAPDPLAAAPAIGRQFPTQGPLRPGAEQQAEALATSIGHDETFQRLVGFQLYVVGSGALASGIVDIEGAACHVVAAGLALQARYGADRTRLILYPLPGKEPAQPQNGKGWRLLAELPLIAIEPAVQVATDAAAYRALMARLRVATPPKVDLERSIVVALMTSGGPHAGRPESEPCDWVHFDGITVDVAARTVVAKILHPRPPGVGCDTMFTAFTYVVEIDRSVVPPRPFTLRVLNGTCDDCTNDIVIRSN